MSKTKQFILDQANADNAAYPQYKGHWDGPEWVLIYVKDKIVTKGNRVAFMPGDVTIAQPWIEKGNPIGPQEECWSAYSLRNKINTVIPRRLFRTFLF